MYHSAWISTCERCSDRYVTSKDFPCEACGEPSILQETHRLICCSNACGWATVKVLCCECGEPMQVRPQSRLLSFVWGLFLVDEEKGG